MNDHSCNGKCANLLKGKNSTCVPHRLKSVEYVSVSMAQWGTRKVYDSTFTTTAGDVFRAKLSCPVNILQCDAPSLGFRPNDVQSGIFQLSMYEKHRQCTPEGGNVQYCHCNTEREDVKPW